MEENVQNPLGAIDVSDVPTHELKPLRDFVIEYLERSEELTENTRIAPIYGTDYDPEYRTKKQLELDLALGARTISWKVIAWTQRDGETLIVKHSDIDGQSYSHQYSDTIFPIIGLMGECGAGVIDILPVRAVLNAEFQLIYRNCISLVLLEKTVSEGAGERAMHVPRAQAYQKITVKCVNNAKIGCFFMKDAGYVQKYMQQGLVSQIMDRYNTEFPFIGLFGGQPFDSDGRQLLLQLWPRSQFRCEVSFDLMPLNRVRSFRSVDVFVPRLGYLVSKDGLFVVTEVLSETRHISSLLKRETFLILEGRHRYERNYTTQHTGSLHIWLSWMCGGSEDGIPYPPKILIVGEGVNEIRIHREESRSTGIPYRSSYLFLHNASECPTILDWHRFQYDFQLFNVRFRGRFRNIMHIREINDWIRYPSEALGCDLIISLIDSPFVGLNNKNITEFWNIFVPITDSDNFFAYIKTTKTVFNIRNRNELWFYSSHDFRYPDPITDKRFTYFQHDLRQLERAYRELPHNSQARRHMWNTVCSTFNDQRQNGGYYSVQRQHTMKAMALKVIIQ